MISAPCAQEPLQSLAQIRRILGTISRGRNCTEPSRSAVVFIKLLSDPQVDGVPEHNFRNSAPDALWKQTLNRETLILRLKQSEESGGQTPRATDNPFLTRDKSLCGADCNLFYL